MITPPPIPTLLTSVLSNIPGTGRGSDKGWCPAAPILRSWSRTSALAPAQGPWDEFAIGPKPSTAGYRRPAHRGGKSSPEFESQQRRMSRKERVISGRKGCGGFEVNRQEVCLGGGKSRNQEGCLGFGRSQGWGEQDFGERAGVVVGTYLI